MCLSILPVFDGHAHNFECNNFLTHSIIHCFKVAFMKVNIYGHTWHLAMLRWAWQHSQEDHANTRVGSAEFHGNCDKCIIHSKWTQTNCRAIQESAEATYILASVCGRWLWPCALKLSMHSMATALVHLPGCAVWRCLRVLKAYNKST